MDGVSPRAVTLSLGLAGCLYLAVLDGTFQEVSDHPGGSWDLGACVVESLP